jgi:hypothetical protein
VGRECGTHWRVQKSVKGLGEKDRRKETFGRPRHRWEDGNKMDLKEIGWEGTWLRIGTGGGLL